MLTDKQIHWDSLREKNLTLFIYRRAHIEQYKAWLYEKKERIHFMENSLDPSNIDKKLTQMAINMVARWFNISTHLPPRPSFKKLSMGRR